MSQPASSPACYFIHTGLKIVIMLNFLNYCFHLLVVMCCMFSIMQSPLLFFLLLSARLLRLVHFLMVFLTNAPLVLFLFYIKVFERILHDQMLEHVNFRNMLSDLQFGYTVWHITATALIRVTEYLRSAKAEGKVTVHVLLDFFRAFDLINHGLFVHKLDSRYDFHNSANVHGFIVSSGSLYGR
jgi:hypothetical protein